MKAIAFCWLAYCGCSENKGCVGCQDGGCESHGWCKNCLLLKRSLQAVPASGHAPHAGLSIRDKNLKFSKIGKVFFDLCAILYT